MGNNFRMISNFLKIYLKKMERWCIVTTIFVREFG